MNEKHKGAWILTQGLFTVLLGLNIVLAGMEIRDRVKRKKEGCGCGCSKSKRTVL